MRRLFFLLILAASAAFGQAVSRGGGGSITACAGDPGNTVGAYRSLCVTSAGAVYACKTSGGCTLAAHWQAQAGATAAPAGSSGQVQWNNGAGGLGADDGMAYNSGTKAVGIKGPISAGAAGVGNGSINLLGSTSGTANITTNSTGAAVVLDKPLATSGGITAGQNSGTGGSLTLNGATSGSAAFTVAADGSSVAVNKLFVLPTRVPASANAAGVAGTVTWGDGFVYVCIATNTWQRAALATW